jgi:hypothetical protein
LDNLATGGSSGAILDIMFRAAATDFTDWPTALQVRLGHHCDTIARGTTFCCPGNHPPLTTTTILFFFDAAFFVVFRKELLRPAFTAGPK